MLQPTAWPIKRREIHTDHMNAATRNDLAHRDGDIVAAAYGRSGTTWTQILAQLLFDGAGGIDIHRLFPWNGAPLAAAA